MSYPNSAANADAVLAGTLGGMCSGQLSTDGVQADYLPYIAPAVATAVTVDGLVGVTSAPPPLVAQSNIIAELCYAAWDGRNPASGTAGEDATEIEASLSGGLPEGVLGAFTESLVFLGAGTTGNTPSNLNAAFAGALGAMLDGAVNTDSTAADYALVASAAYSAAVAVDGAIGVDGSASVIRENMVCEVTFAWLKQKGLQAAGTTSDEIAALAAEMAPLGTAIAQYWSFAVDAMVTPADIVPPSGGVPASANVWNAAFCGGFGGILTGQTVAGETIPSGPIDFYVSAAASFAYAIDAALAAYESGRITVSTVAQENILRHICRAWMTGRNPPDNTTATTIASYDDIANGIVAYFAEIIDASIIQ